MFFSKVVLFAISLGAISVLATPHALQHHALHRRAVAARAVAARVASAPSNSSEVTVKRQNSAKCNNRLASSSSPSIPPAATPNVENTPIVKNPAVVPPPAATPTTTPKPTPTPTPHQDTPPAPKPTTSSPAPANTPPPSNGGGATFTDGDGTFYAAGLGSCGFTNTDNDYIVAVSQSRYDASSNGPNPNTNPLCGKKIRISYGGASAVATIVDRCTGCAYNSIDMTPTLFKVFSPLGVGRIHNLAWSFL